MFDKVIDKFYCFDSLFYFRPVVTMNQDKTAKFATFSLLTLFSIVSYAKEWGLKGDIANADNLIGSLSAVGLIVACYISYWYKQKNR